MVKRHLLPVPAFGVFGVLVVGFAACAAISVRDIQPTSTLRRKHPLYLMEYRRNTGNIFLRRCFPSDLPVCAVVPQGIVGWGRYATIKFNLTSLAGITQTDEMELGEIGERKTAVFAVIPDSDSSYNFIVGMLYTQLFQQLYRKADFEHGGRLPVHVHFVMDEFANVALPDDFDKLLATMRSREISVSIILQNLAQLKALFDKQWESIVGNCDTFLYLGGNEQSTHEYVSKLLGKQTIDTNTYGRSKGRSGSYTTNFQTAGRELMTPDEVRMLDNRYALLFIRGERPVKDLKYNILKHPNVALTTDGQAAAYQHGTDPLSVAAVSINLEKLKQAVPEDTDTGDYVILTEEEVYDFMRRKAQENNQNQNSNYQEVTYEKHHPQHHSSHPSYF